MGLPAIPMVSDISGDCCDVTSLGYVALPNPHLPAFGETRRMLEDTTIPLSPRHSIKLGF